MSISQVIRAGLAGRAPFHDRLEQFVAGDGGVTVRCEVRQAEQLGCALTRVELVSDVPGRLSNKELVAQAEKLCKRVSYLSEPLRLIELDARTATALVRSEKPKLKDGSLWYYELLADAERHTTLRRYSFDRIANKRSATEFVLTAEQLEQLVDDLVAVAGVSN
jgi:hypothetical protein